MSEIAPEEGVEVVVFIFARFVESLFSTGGQKETGSTIPNVGLKNNGAKRRSRSEEGRVGKTKVGVWMRQFGD